GALEPRRPAPREAGGRGTGRHVLGGRERSNSGRSVTRGPRPAARVVHRDHGPEREWRRIAGVRGARLRGVPRLLRVGAEGHLHRRVHAQAQPDWALPTPDDPRRGALRARDVRRAAERPRGGAAVIAALSAVVVLAAGVVPSPVPSFESVRATWRSSD